MWIYILCFLLLNLIIYFFTRLTRGLNRSSVCLLDKTAIITGANSGLGYHTALGLASRGCRIIMADVVDMEQSKGNIIKYTNNTNIMTKELDLASLQSVRAFANDINRSEEKIHILMNNAGIPASAEKFTKDGLDPVMQINYFGHFLLTHLLIDLLKKSAPSRIVFTSSILAFTNNLSLNNFMVCKKPKFLPDFFIYGNSKLAMLIASDIFAQKLKGTGVTSNCVYPGFVKTDIFRKYFTILGFTPLRFGCTYCSYLFYKDVWEGAQTLVYAAVSKKLENVSGKFFTDCKSFFKPLSAYNIKWCQEIWKASEDCVGLRDSEKL